MINQCDPGLIGINMPQCKKHSRPAGGTSRRTFLKGAAALALTGRALAQAQRKRGSLQIGPSLAYVGTYSNPQGPEGGKKGMDGAFTYLK